MNSEKIQIETVGWLHLGSCLEVANHRQQLIGRPAALFAPTLPPPARHAQRQTTLALQRVTTISDLSHLIAFHLVRLFLRR